MPDPREGLSVDDLARELDTTGARTVLIDGRSGSGKSTLADELCALWRDSVVVRLDDIYPGWDGLACAVDHINTELLAPRAQGRPGRWRRWDWATSAPADWHTVDADQRLIVEGAGALTPDGRRLADLGIWVEADDQVRKQRALERDGETYAPHWDRWAAQEAGHIGRHRPRTVADYLMNEGTDGTARSLTRR